MAETEPRKRAPRKTTTPAKPVLQLVPVPCPARCDKGKTLVFQQHVGTFVHEECRRCRGVGEVEVQRVCTCRS